MCKRENREKKKRETRKEKKVSAIVLFPLLFSTIVSFLFFSFFFVFTYVCVCVPVFYLIHCGFALSFSISPKSIHFRFVSFFHHRHRQCFLSFLQWVNADFIDVSIEREICSDNIRQLSRNFCSIWHFSSLFNHFNLGRWKQKNERELWPNFFEQLLEIRTRSFVWYSEEK